LQMILCRKIRQLYFQKFLLGELKNKSQYQKQ